MGSYLEFADWIGRFSDAEYSLLRHRMRGIQFAGPNIMRRWDVGLARDWIDLADPIVPAFKQLLIGESIVSAARVEVIFALDGTTSSPPGDNEGNDGISDAPQDNNIYGRQNANWVAIGSEGGMGPPGPQGPEGQQGIKGEPGPAGPIGAVGPAGPQGEVGPEGALGPQGDQGPQGTQGPQGPAGSDGAQGVAGAEGAQGPPGAPGPQGPAGQDGAQGLPGGQGEAGAQGPPGSQGPAGNEGVEGSQGPAGAPGTAGPQGAAGPEGPQGTIGPAGPAGPEGAQGMQGAQGSPGPSSDTWGYVYSSVPAAPPQGQQIRFDNANPQAASKMWLDHTDTDGIDVTNYLMLMVAGDEVYTQDKNDSTRYDIYTVISDPLNKGAYNEIPIAWARGSATTLNNNQASVVSLMRKGAVGATGPQGPIGPEGPAGPTGPQGIQGQQGLQGEIGPQGTGGAVGAKGDPGPAGTAGATGPAGAQGTQGAAGLPGATGAQGPAGIGTTGPQGIQGATGAQGAQGIQGPPGPTAVSAQAGNTATLGSDNLIYVPTLPPASNAVPTMNGTAATGIATAWARGDHVHPSDNTRVPFAGGTMTGRLDLKGVTDGTDAVAGMVGEYLTASNATGTTLTTGTPANIASLSLQAGDWRIDGVVAFVEAANTIPTQLLVGTSPTSATIPTLTQVIGGQGGLSQLNATMTKGLTQYMQAGLARINVTSPTTIYLVAQSTFSGGTLSAQGRISARRMR